MRMLFARIRNRYKGNDFLRAVTVLVGGTAIAQLVMILLLPVLTRLYSPEDFNTLSVYLALLGILGVIATLRFELAIPQPQCDEDAANLLALSLASSVVTALLVAALLYLSSPYLAGLLKLTEMSAYFWMLPVGVFLSGTYSGFQFWVGRRKNFKIVAHTKMQQALSAGTVQVVFGWLQSGAGGLVLGQTINNGAGAIGLAWHASRNDAQLLRKVSVAGMRRMFTAYDRFPKFSALEALANNGSIQIPVILIASLAIGPEAGFLLLAMQIMQAPIGLIGSAVSQVYLSGAPEKLRQGCLPEFTLDTLAGIVRLGVLPLVIGGVSSPYLFAFVFGDAWQRTGEIVVYMIPWIAMQLLVSPISMVLHTTNNQPLAMWLQVFGLVLRVGVVAAASVLTPTKVTEIYAVTGFLFYFAYLCVVLKIAGGTWGAFARRNGIILAGVLALYLVQLLVMLNGSAV